MNPSEFHAGHVALVGRPNVGKSTLLNAAVGAHIAIVSPRPQTTRQRTLGVVTGDDFQIAFVDTPGLSAQQGKALDRRMHGAVQAALEQVDLACLVIEAGRLEEGDRFVLAQVLRSQRPVSLVVNKIDRIQPRERLLPYLAEVSKLADFRSVHLVAANKRDGLKAWLSDLGQQLPVQPPLYDADTLTDRSERFLAAELVREQLMRQLHDEIPYGIAVITEAFEVADGMRRIQATIWVNRDSHKGIVIGQRGEQLKSVGSAARVAMEALFDGRVHLELWVKVRPQWADDEAALHELGL
ncbi:MAG: GTPase Era [Xanthomonadales bacterium]|nr:GTPase Era [Xanthomonadales bacterium]